MVIKRIKQIGALSVLATSLVLLLSGCVPTFGDDGDAPCVSPEKEYVCTTQIGQAHYLRKEVEDNVAKTKRYLAKRPHATLLAQRFNLSDRWTKELYGYVLVQPDSSYKRWIITAQYGGGLTDGALYYDSKDNAYHLCGDYYLQAGWNVPVENQSKLCPRVLGWTVDEEVLNPSTSNALE